MTYSLLLLAHLIAATIWTGGHIVLCLVILPKVLRAKSPEMLLDFEQAFEKVGMPALIIQVITGLLLAYHWLPDVSLWFSMNNPISHGIAGKLLLLALTFGLALDAKLRVLPKLSSNNLWDMALHIIAVTFLSVGFVALGLSFRLAWFA
ncbi:copper resistance protein CopD [Agarivorans sp. B2Z047]|uniref:copper resistance protein CopD n=1 Tax=Agarivorans sp. B2Z047 TaxID=2652721 RepID=UPI00128B8EFD|nr:copper resistance protein CopD [Agarivorans sp. B2Z047]MPW28545.1 copper resistance protein CopD [Agarivorans sp. B2Z047]UQN41106.1 copper resistance protein CopD [Agarivorans sp. B2Z047]